MRRRSERRSARARRRRRRKPRRTPARGSSSWRAAPASPGRPPRTRRKEAQAPPALAGERRDEPGEPNGREQRVHHQRLVGEKLRRREDEVFVIDVGQQDGEHREAVPELPDEVRGEERRGDRDRQGELAGAQELALGRQGEAEQQGRDVEGDAVLRLEARPRRRGPRRGARGGPSRGRPAAGSKPLAPRRAVRRSDVTERSRGNIKRRIAMETTVHFLPKIADL